jgi:hypothetical protein
MKRSANFEQRDYGQVWTHKGNKFVIGTLHGTTLEITAQYNPKELSRQASATWTPHPNTSAKQSPSADTHLWMEYGTTAPRTLTLELLFDGYEEGISIAKVVEDLESLTMPVNMGSRIPSERRPQACVAVWGSQSLRCVVTSVSTNLTMFDATGEPLRAICSVTLQEVDVAAMMQADKGNSDFVSRQEQIAAHSNIDKHTTRRHWTNDAPVVAAVSRAQAQRGAPTSDAPKTVGTPSSTFAGPPASKTDGAAPAPKTETTPEGRYQVGTPTRAFTGEDDQLDSAPRTGNPTDVLTTDPE